MSGFSVCGSRVTSCIDMIARPCDRPGHARRGRACLLSAARTSARYRLSIGTAIVEAARALGCETVLSEDLNDGQDFGGVIFENPFRGTSR